MSGAAAGGAGERGRGRAPVVRGPGRDAGSGLRRRGRAWVELLRLPALLTVPGDALDGAAATGSRPTRGTFLAVGASVSLYAAGMALNDWADRDEDARDRPHRPLPSGRIRPAHALAAAGALTGAGLALACRAGRTTGAVATALAATVWAYDLRLKGTAAGPPAMGTARALDLLMGAAATRPAGAPGPLPQALTAAATLAAHTTAVTTVSRNETQGGSVTGPLTALATGTAIAAALLAPRARDVRWARGEGRGASGGVNPRAAGDGLPSPYAEAGMGVGAALSTKAAPRLLRGRRDNPAGPLAQRPQATSPAPITLTLPVTAYATTALRPLFHAALNPSPPLTQRAVGAGIRALVPLQSALAARSGAPVTALATLALAPLARHFAKKVSVT
ncbi:SCO3242 family prenyltransferase [Streptomyces sp. NBC_00483]|uniref:SCO3242 family prenyltransferase n=1 Tax=Streptomyces sp. NBC_00483 TaxID=2975756 RepID=UPI003FCD05C9